jgi:outer membrane receptor for ferrienterochelin and colicins
MIQFKKFFIALLILFSTTISAQNVTLTGKIVDVKGQPIYGVFVSLKGTYIFTKSDASGNYVITVPHAFVPGLVQYSAVGMEKQEFNVDGVKKSVEFSPTMKEEVLNIGDVVVSASKKSEKIFDAPSSVSVLGEERIRNTPAITVIDVLKKVGAVDIMPTGLVSHNVTVRGFNNIFSGSLLYAVDNRLAAVPSLKVNAFQLVPTSNSDIQKMEVVRGPASALYGPNAANGVLAVYTKNTLDMKHKMEVTVAMTTGIRSVEDSILAGGHVSGAISDRLILNPEFRIAAKINDKLGIKFSGSLLDANDFENYDSREISPGKKLYFGENKNGGLYKVIDSAVSYQRNFKIQRQTGDLRIDYRSSDKLSFILSGGLSQASNFELTGLGGAQVKNWISYNTQLQMRMSKLFVQIYLNGSESGSTFLVPQGASNQSTYLEDFSKQIVTQIQHTSSLMSNKINLVYGADFIKTIPNSFNTIYGRFDSSNDVAQYGGYIQGEYKPSLKLSLIAAFRADYNDKINEFMPSPRAAIVYKANDNHVMRMTYNRAFSAPSILNLSLDLANGSLPNGVYIRGMGNPNGLTYSKVYDTLQYINAYTGKLEKFRTKNNAVANTAHFEIIKNALASRFEGQIPANLVALFKSALFAGMDMSAVDRAAVDLPNYSQSGDFDGSVVQTSSIKNKESIKSTVTQTIEGGYKGYFGKKLKIGLDIYGSRTENFISPLTTASFSVMYNQSQYMKAILSKLGQNIQALGQQSPQALALLNSVLDQNPTNGGNSNGSSVDELATILGKLNVGMNMGTISPTNGFIGKDVILTYTNLGTVDLFGADLSLNYQVTDRITIDGSASHVNKDRIATIGAAHGYIGLNAPKWKSSIGITHTFGFSKAKSESFTWGANWRWYDAFPGNSAIYTGTVNAVNLIDLTLLWKPITTMPNTIVSLSMNNALDTKHQFFPGTPYMGRTTMLKLSHTFVKK